MRLPLQHCATCGVYHYVHREQCPQCWSTELTAVPASGKGRLLAFTVVHRAPRPQLADAVPYTLAVVELDEGPRLMVRLTGAAPTSAKIGDNISVQVIAGIATGTVLPST